MEGQNFVSVYVKIRNRNTCIRKIVSHDEIGKKNNKIENSIRNALHRHNLHKSINKGRKAIGFKRFQWEKK